MSYYASMRFHTKIVELAQELLDNSDEFCVTTGTTGAAAPFFELERKITLPFAQLYAERHPSGEWRAEFYDERGAPAFTAEFRHAVNALEWLAQTYKRCQAAREDARITGVSK